MIGRILKYLEKRLENDSRFLAIREEELAISKERHRQEMIDSAMHHELAEAKGVVLGLARRLKDVENFLALRGRTDTSTEASKP